MGRDTCVIGAPHGYKQSCDACCRCYAAALKVQAIITTVVNALLHEQEAALSSRACHSKTPVHAYVVPHKLPACQVAACSGVISGAD